MRIVVWALILYSIPLAVSSPFLASIFLGAEFHVAKEADGEAGLTAEEIILPGDDDSAFVDWGADFEADAIVREEDELGGVPYLQHLRVIEEHCDYF